MKIKVIIILTLGLSLISCNKKVNDEKPILTVSIEPQRYFLEQLVGDKYTVNCAIPAGSNPETFAPTPSQLANISKSKVYLTIGTLFSEKIFIDKISSYNTGLEIIDCSLNIPLLEEDHHCEFSSEHEHGDPHIWSSPSTMRIIVKNMYDAIIDIDEANKEYYKANYDSIVIKIDKTDKQIKEYLSKTANKDFIIYHPALGYFAKEYGLHQLTIEHAGKNPSPAHLAKLIDKAKKENIRIVFIQKEFDIRNTETLANEINGETYVINLLNYNWEEELTNIAKAFTNE